MAYCCTCGRNGHEDYECPQNGAQYPPVESKIIVSEKLVRTQQWSNEDRVPRSEVYKVIDSERTYQENLPGNRSENPKRIRAVSEYLTMLDHYVRHAQDSWTTRAGIEQPLHDMRKIAALAVRCMEEWGALPRETK